MKVNIIIMGCNVSSKGTEGHFAKRKMKRGQEIMVNENHDIYKDLSSKVMMKTSTKLADFYNIDKVLGKGAYSSVSLASNLENPSIQYAVKSMGKMVNEKQMKNVILHELYVLRQLDHPGIIFWSEAFETDTHINAILELSPGITLEHYLEEWQQGLDFEKLSLMYQICKTASYLKNKSMVHRDFKTANVIVSPFSSNLLLERSCQVIDFGFIKDNSKDKSRWGTPQYMAPEAFKKDSSSASDVWSLGIIFYNMIWKDYPFAGDDAKELYEAIALDYIEFKPDFLWEQVPSLLIDLISKMLEKDSKKRLTIEQVLSHEIFDEINKLSYDLQYAQEEIDCLVKFNKLSKLQTVIAQCAVRYIDSRVKGACRERFMMLDKKNSGFIYVPSNIKKQVTVKYNSSRKSTKDLSLSSEFSPNSLDVDSDKNTIKIPYSSYMASMVDPNVLCCKNISTMMFNSLNVSGKSSESITLKDLKLSHIFDSNVPFTDTDLAQLCSWDKIVTCESFYTFLKSIKAILI